MEDNVVAVKVGDKAPRARPAGTTTTILLQERLKALKEAHKKKEAKVAHR